MAERGPWRNMRESKNIEDRTDEPFPWHQLATTERLQQMTPTNETQAGRLRNIITPEDIPPITTRLQQQAGAGDVAPITPEEMMKFMMDIEFMNPYQETKRMNDPIKRK